jgi:hypothetical protein
MYPAQPQYGPPPGQYPQQGYAPAPQPAPVQMMAPGGAPQPVLMDPTVGGEPGPSVAELENRCCLFIPRKIARNQPDKYNQGKFKDEVTCDIVVLDGGNFYFGAAPKAQPPRPQPTHVTAVPVAFTNRIIGNGNMVAALERAVGTGAVVGIVRQGVGDKGNPPWNIYAVDANDPRRQLAVAYLNGQLQLAKPTELSPQPVAQLPPNPYGQPMPQQPAQMAPAPQYAPPAPQGYPQPIVPQAQPQQAPQAFQQQPAPQYAPAPDHSNQAYPQQPNGAAQPVWMPPAPQAPAEPGPPPGYEAMWPQLTPEQRQQVLAHVAQQAAPQPVAPNPYS